MLKQAQPGKVRRLGGAVLMALIIPLGIGAAYAATSPAPLPGTGSGLSHASEYQLAMKIELADGNDATEKCAGFPSRCARLRVRRRA